MNKSEINKGNFLLVAECKKAASALAAFHSVRLLAPQAGRVRRQLSGLNHGVASLHFSTGNNPSSRRCLLTCFVHLVQTHGGVTALRREASVQATKHVVGRGLQKLEVPRGLEVESRVEPVSMSRLKPSDATISSGFHRRFTKVVCITCTIRSTFFLWFSQPSSIGRS